MDDEETICTVVSNCLKDWPGTEVDCAHDGVAGVKRLQSTKFNLAIIDSILPNLSGLEVAQVTVNDGTPVVMLSGHPDVTTKLALVDLPHLEKPFGWKNFSANQRPRLLIHGRTSSGSGLRCAVQGTCRGTPGG